MIAGSRTTILAATHSSLGGPRRRRSSLAGGVKVPVSGSGTSETHLLLTGCVPQQHVKVELILMRLFSTRWDAS